MRDLLLVLRRRAMSGAAMAALLLSATVATGCGGEDSESGSQAAGGSDQAGKTYTVGIDIPFHPIFDYVMGRSEEYFAGKPYRVEFKVLDATTQVPAFGKGDLDVMTTVPSFIPRVTEQYGIEVAEFFPLARWTIGPQILVAKDSPYRTLEDLEGKKVAIPPLKTRFGAEEAAILAVTGQNIRDYFELAETDAAAQQVSLGRVDAAFIEAPTTYPLLKSGDFNAVYSVADAFGQAFDDDAVVNGGYIARRDLIESNPQFIQDLIAATQDAWNRYNEDPEQVNEVASKVSGVPAEQLKVVGEVLNLDGIPPEQRAITEQDVETWKQIFPLLEKSGFIEKAPEDVEALFEVTK